MEFAEAKQKKERGYTVKECLEELKDSDELVVVSVKDGLVYTSYSTTDGDVPKMLGLLEMGKKIILDNN
ncbi:hypothetical protein BKP56_07150 [Marinilactibacillus sp. 15R]|uniref:hypothetical protein n=1 Tax=Marinilactibacillus sp. 15R TaxID=1911586 RepID=UPI00090ABADD|nr:hypothetical protein [Marinilactibacillus sp. 15R]API89043.1 hypothetical protein BKP56_07150 [Marinilactibacillus sp. 15R]